MSLSSADLPRTFRNCTWSERRLQCDRPLWLDGWYSRWYCLALSERVGRLIEVQPERCAKCPFWQARAESLPRAQPQ